MRFHHFLFLSLFLFILPAFTHAEITPGDEGNFITTWNTENPGTSASNQITIPHAPGSTYHYDLYWENTASSTMNGTTTVSGSGAASSPTLIFPEPGIYRVEIAGTFPRIHFNNAGDKDKILTVEKWGGIGIAWTSMANAFYGCINLTVPATDAPNLSGVTSMNQMFREAYQVNQPMGHWDVSTIQNMAILFGSLTNPISQSCQFNQDIGAWDMSSVTTVDGMFWRCTNFNQDISLWNTSSTTNMGYMFYCNTSFNQDVGTKVVNTGEPDEYIAWDVSNVTRFDHMFWLSRSDQCPGPSAFNNLKSDSIGNWDTSNAVNLNAGKFRLLAQHFQ